MGYMDILKNAMGMQPSNEPKQIDADGKHYTFIPGKNGSLTAPLNKTQKPIYEPHEPVAKVVGPNKVAQVGSSRG